MTIAATHRRQLLLAAPPWQDLLVGGVLPHQRRLPDTPQAWTDLRSRIDAAVSDGGMARVRALLPHYATGNSGISHPEPSPAERSAVRLGGLNWASYRVWAGQAVSLACACRPEAITAHATTPARVREVCGLVGLYARGRDGRDAVVGQATLAALMGCTTRTVQRALAAATALGLLAVVFHGRHLTWIESAEAYANGSTQRRFANVYDCTTPADLAARIALDAARRHTNVAPTGGKSPLIPESSSVPCSRRFAAGKIDAAARRRQQTRARRAKSPAYQLAKSLTLRVIWLRTTSRGRLCGLLARYAAAPRPWTGTQLVAAMDRINHDLHIDAPNRATTSPFGLLAWYLSRIDPIHDHPEAGRMFDEPVPHCTCCGRTRQVHDRYAAATGDPHPWQPDIPTSQETR